MNSARFGSEDLRSKIQHLRYLQVSQRKTSFKVKMDWLQRQFLLYLASVNRAVALSEQMLQVKL